MAVLHTVSHSLMTPSNKTLYLFGGVSRLHELMDQLVSLYGVWRKRYCKINV